MVFHIISKLFSFLLSPVGVLLVLILASMFASRPRRRRLYQRWLLGLFLLFTNSIFVNEVILFWQHPPKLRSEIQPHDVGVLLTGGLMTESVLPPNLHVDAAADRLIQTMFLYKEKKIRKIIISGGRLFNGRRVGPEATIARNFLIANGVPATDVLLDTEALNTYENAKFSAKILREHFPNQSYILITSSTHMPRSVASFKKQGIEVTPFGSNYTTNSRLYKLSDFSPNEIAFYQLYLVAHEIVGYGVYWLMGYL